MNTGSANVYRTITGAADKVLKQPDGVEEQGCETVHTKLDLLWARLAVHIRAEHLHLFPAVTNRFTEVESVVESINWHAQIAISSCVNSRVRLVIFVNFYAAGECEGRGQIDCCSRRGSREVENRLVNHNEVEENQIYRWAGTILTEPEQLD